MDPLVFIGVITLWTIVIHRLAFWLPFWLRRKRWAAFGAQDRRYNLPRMSTGNRFLQKYYDKGFNQND